MRLLRNESVGSIGWRAGVSPSYGTRRIRGHSPLRLTAGVVASIVLTTLALSNESIAFGAAGVTSINLIANGSFEHPVVKGVPGGGDYQLFQLGQTVSGWSVVGAAGSVGIIARNFYVGANKFPAQAGGQFLDLTGDSNTTTGVSENVKTVPNHRYVLSFYVAACPYGGCLSTDAVKVLLNGKQVMIARTRTTKGQTTLSWKRFSKAFISASATTTVEFLNGDPPTELLNGLDNISLVR